MKIPQLKQHHRARWTGLAGKPLVYHLHDILSLEHFSRSNLWLLVGLANRRAGQVIANSEASRTAFLAAGGKTPVSVCYNGFDCQPFDAWHANRLENRRQHRSPWQLADQPVVGVFGRFAPWKGQHVAIDAIRALPGVHLLLVGDALFGEEEYKRKLLAMAEAPELAGRIHFLGFRDDVGELMQAVDVVAHCSTAPEPFGRVIVEAMLSRRPIVASRAGGAMEIVEHCVSGLLAEPGVRSHDAGCRMRNS